MDTFIQTTDFILFLCFSLMTVYLGVLAIAASLRNDALYPQAGKRHRFAILVPPGSTSLPLPHYPEELYQVFTYEDLTEAIAALNENDFDGVVVLGETIRIEPAFLEEINNVFDAGIQAIQLRHITENRSTRKQYFPGSERRNHSGPVRDRGNPPGSVIGFIRCGHGIGLEMAEKNQKSRKSNLERRLVRQGIFVEYLEKVKVYSSDIRTPRYKVRFSKALRALPEAIFTAHWDYCNKILRWILPSRKTNLISIALIATALLCYDWSLSLKWWSLLYILMFIICLATRIIWYDKKQKNNQLSRLWH